ncbi:MAG: neutral/alkaline non-lysosomal ceramidase N-terminal domain-containing protein [Planctomycetota bacterium]|nr:neutral/alkaline non-lysosomal ceramidase N-terminal domain-containing protein [Planctomycetota bacterium]
MRKRIPLRVVTVLSAIFIACVLTAAGRAELRGGCAKVNITPPVGVWLSGYGSRDKPSDDIFDDLYTKALVLDDGNNAVAIISVDLLWVPPQITGEVRAIVTDKTGIPGKNVLISPTHTHFGPRIFSRMKLGPQAPDNKVDAAYVRTLVKKMANSVFIAHKNMQDVKLGVVRGRLPEIVYNRRTRLADGTVKMSFSLPDEVIATRRIEQGSDGSTRVAFTLPPEQPELTFGPIDPETWILRVENSDGQIVGSLVNFACHAVSGSGFEYWFYSISTDFPGETTRIVEQAEGGICLFAPGTSGNIVPLKRGKEARFEIGKAIAGEAIRRLQFVRTTDDVKIEAMRTEVTIPLKQDLSPDRIMDAGEDKKHLTTEFQILKLGDVYILALPGEVLVEIGLEIKRKAGIQKLLIIALANDPIGYVCHGEAYDEGGYESGTGTNLAKGAGEIMVKQALDLIGRIKPGK